MVSWSVDTLAGFPGIELGDNGLDWADKEMLSSYNTEMNSVISTFKDWKTNPDPDAYYLFVVPNFSQTDVEGYMPRNRRFGFVTKDQLDARTIAHELGHGAFNLYHTFSTNGWGIAENSTNNLMDYNNGSKLYKPQWDLIHNPETTTGLFDGMDEGASMEYVIFKGYPEESFEVSDKDKLDLYVLDDNDKNDIKTYKNKFEILTNRLIVLVKKVFDNNISFSTGGCPEINSYNKQDKIDGYTIPDGYNAYVITFKEKNSICKSSYILTVNQGSRSTKAILLDHSVSKKIVIKSFSPTFISLDKNEEKINIKFLISKAAYYEEKLNTSYITALLPTINYKEKPLITIFNHAGDIVYEKDFEEYASSLSSSVRKNSYDEDDLGFWGTFEWDEKDQTGKRITADDLPLKLMISYKDKQVELSLNFNKDTIYWGQFPFIENNGFFNLDNILEKRQAIIDRLREIGIDPNKYESPIQYMNENFVSGDFLGQDLPMINIRFLYLLRKIEEALGRQKDWVSNSASFNELCSKSKNIDNSARLTMFGSSLSDHALGFAFDFDKQNNICFSYSPSQLKFVELVTGVNLSAINSTQLMSDANTLFINTVKNLDEDEFVNSLKSIDEKKGRINVLGSYQSFHDKIIAAKNSILSLIDQIPIQNPMPANTISDLIAQVTDVKNSLTDSKTFVENAYVGLFMNSSLTINYKKVETEYNVVVSTLTNYINSADLLLGVLNDMAVNASDLETINQKIRSWQGVIKGINPTFDSGSLSTFIDEVKKRTALSTTDKLTDFWNKVSHVEPDPKKVSNGRESFGSLLLKNGFFNLDPKLVAAILSVKVDVNGKVVVLKWGGNYGSGGADFMHFEVKPTPSDRSHQAALQSLDIKLIKEYLNSFKKMEGKENYSY